MTRVIRLLDFWELESNNQDRDMMSSIQDLDQVSDNVKAIMMKAWLQCYIEEYKSLYGQVGKMCQWNLRGYEDDRRRQSKQARMGPVRS